MTETKAYRSWRSGELVPGRIALARAYPDLPQQSVANVCGTDAETVDLWEQGAEYPGWAELIDLMTFTGRGVEFFTRAVSGDGALFTVPQSWQGDCGEVKGLRDEFCSLAVSAAVYGWPRNEEAVPQSMFV